MALNDLTFLSLDAPWPPESEKLRIDQYTANYKLFQCLHNEVFDQWYRLLRHDENAALEIILNWPKRLSTLWADLVVGEPPRFSVGEQGGSNQERLKDLLARTHYTTTLYEAVIDISRYGVAVFKTLLKEGEAEVSLQAPYHWFPVTSPGNGRDVKQHVLAFTYEKDEYEGKNKRTVKYLKVEIHTKGEIEHRLYRLSSSEKLVEELSAQRIREDFPDIAGEDDGRIYEETGIDDFLVHYVPGLRGSGKLHGSDDYWDLEGVLQEFEVRIAQISRILDEHADPNMYGPANAVTIDPITGEGIFEAGGKFFPTTGDDVTPGYLTWEGQLTAAYKQLEVLMEQFYLISETSPAAFGKMDAGLAPSGTALRRLMLAPLAKASRLKMLLDPVAKRVLEVCGELEDAHSSELPGISLDGLDITWNDGLPNDETEQTANEVARITAGLTSRLSAIKRLYDFDDEQAQAELDRIATERATEAPQTNSVATSNGGAPQGASPLIQAILGPQGATQNTEVLQQ